MGHGETYCGTSRGEYEKLLRERGRL